ncbi:hypothetical protein Acr_13g0004260 [Actinidia rufa]|uniref:O-methyltransferase dimerisation domain-containing protein n=1 Tax=Actinidia rufa TaxID=165716 RepID=A0A7J0FK02_9ERIC|nr:hypothetical protein Acr_13g0004260 [Actinidia rufa]
MEKCSSDEQGKELLLQSQAHIWNHLFNFINSMSLKCAIELDIPDIVNNHGRPMTLSELVAALPINPSKSHCVYRLMRILVHSGFFTKEKVSKNGEDEEEEQGGYLLTPPSRFLLKDEPFSVTPFLLAMLDPTLTKPWHFMLFYSSQRSAAESALMWRTRGSHLARGLLSARVARVHSLPARERPTQRVAARERVAASPLARGGACGRLPARAGAWLHVQPPPGRVWARGSSPVRVAARGTALDAWLRLISLADLQTAREGASGLRFRRGLVLELRIDERNNLV